MRDFTKVSAAGRTAIRLPLVTEESDRHELVIPPPRRPVKEREKSAVLTAISVAVRSMRDGRKQRQSSRRYNGNDNGNKTQYHNNIFVLISNSKFM